jgi:hypothetical protein
MTRHAAEQGSELVRHLLAFSRRQKLEPASDRRGRTWRKAVGALLAHTLGGLVELQWSCEDGIAARVSPTARSLSWRS